MPTQAGLNSTQIKEEEYQKIFSARLQSDYLEEISRITGVENGKNDDDIVFSHQIPKTVCGMFRTRTDYHNCTMRYESFRRVMNNKSLKDDMLQHMNCLLSYDLEEKTIGTKKKNYFFNTYIFTQLKACSKYDSEKKMRRLNKLFAWVGKHNIFNYEKCFVPVHKEPNHWYLMVIYIKEKKIEVFDSLPKENYVLEMEILFNFLSELHKHKNLSTSGLQKKEWDFAGYIQCTRQDNLADCGIYTILHADLVARGYRPLIHNATQSNIRHYVCISAIRCELGIRFLQQNNIEKSPTNGSREENVDDAGFDQVSKASNHRGSSLKKDSQLDDQRYLHDCAFSFSDSIPDDDMSFSGFDFNTSEEKRNGSDRATEGWVSPKTGRKGISKCCKDKVALLGELLIKDKIECLEFREEVLELVGSSTSNFIIPLDKI